MASIIGISPITNPSLSGIVSLNTDTIQNGSITITGNSISGMDKVNVLNLSVSNDTSISGNLILSGNISNKLLFDTNSANIFQGNLVVNSGNLTVNGNIISAGDASFKSLSSVGNLSIGSLKIYSNIKGLTILSNCFTVGTETSATANVIPTGITFTSNSQNGYTIASSSIGRYSYPAYYAFNNGTYAWWSSQNSYDSGGNPTATCATLVCQSGTVAGEWVSITFPYYLVLNNVSCINTDGFFLNATFRTCYIYGQYDNGMPILLKTYTCAGGVQPPIGTYSFPVSTTQPFNRFYFQITLMSNPNGGECAVKQIIFTGTIVDKKITENVYLPQSLEVGRTPNNNLLNTNTSLVVNGNTSLLGDTTILNKLNVSGDIFLGGNVKFQDFGYWCTDYTLSSANSSQGYYVFAGGLCIQWAYFTAPSNTNTTFTFPRAMTHGYACSATKASGNATGYSLKINSLSGTAVVIDTAYGSTSKEACYVVVIGKV